MTPENPAPKEPPVTEPVPAPEIFAEGYISVGLGGGVAKFAFYSFAHGEPSTPPERRIVARLTMPLAGVVGMHAAMGKLIADLKASGQIMDTSNPH
jgi:hypothetical protein